MISESSRFGVSNFGTARFGRNIYAYLDRYGPTGTFIENTNGTITAIFSIPGTVAGAPKLYANLPGEYKRTEVPAYSKTENSSSLYFGDELYYGEGELDYGGSGVVPSSSINAIWYVTHEATVIGTTAVPANSLVVNRYDSRYNLSLDFNIVLEQCPFCQGTSVKNDLILTPLGRLSNVFDTNKLSQQVMKAIMTLKGKNIFYPSYGTIIPEIIGENTLNGFVLREQIVLQLSEIKRMQQQITSQNPAFFTARELLEDVIGVKLTPQTDPRIFGLTITIMNKALEQVSSKTMKIG